MGKSLKLLICLGSVFVGSSAFGQPNSGPLPPPVNIEIATASVPKTGEEIELIIKVTPQEDMHADISCLLPEGVEPIREQGVRIMPFRENQMPINRRQLMRRMNYRFSAGLWVGPLPANQTKEFVLRVNIANPGNYELICRVDALAKWGEKEKIFTINVN
jgi:hypothetical protein